MHSFFIFNSEFTNDENNGKSEVIFYSEFKHDENNGKSEDKNLCK